MKLISTASCATKNLMPFIAGSAQIDINRPYDVRGNLVNITDTLSRAQPQYVKSTLLSCDYSTGQFAQE